MLRRCHCSVWNGLDDGSKMLGDVRLGKSLVAGNGSSVVMERIGGLWWSMARGCRFC